MYNYNSISLSGIRQQVMSGLPEKLIERATDDSEKGIHNPEFVFIL